MKELSLNILDIAMNSVKANAENIKIEITENKNELNISIVDDGKGMSKETLERVTNPFSTTRSTRKVGMGIPLMKLAAEQTGGSFEMFSSDAAENHGTETRVKFDKTHIDFTPLGDIVASITTLIQGSPDIDWIFIHKIDEESVELNTKQLREILGDVSLGNYEVIKWIEDYLKEGYGAIYDKLK